MRNVGNYITEQFEPAWFDFKYPACSQDNEYLKKVLKVAFPSNNKISQISMSMQQFKIVGMVLLATVNTK